VITVKDLDEAILECQGQRNPNAETCIKLAAYLTIKRELYGEPVMQSFSSEPAEKITYNSGTEFSKLIEGQDINDILPIIDELMTTIQTINGRLYKAIIRKIESIV